MFTVPHWRLCCQHGTVKFTINILQCSILGKIKDHYDTKGKQTNGISTTTNPADQYIIQTIKIDQHILETNEQIETQAGFTTGGQIEDNLFVLQYCIEKSYRMKKELIVTCIDYSKAFDSIKRDNTMEALMHYRVHPKIIDTIAKIYQNNFTEIQIGELRKNINITSGTRQECTGRLCYLN